MCCVTQLFESRDSSMDSIWLDFLCSVGFLCLLGMFVKQPSPRWCVVPTFKYFLCFCDQYWRSETVTQHNKNPWSLNTSLFKWCHPTSFEKWFWIRFLSRNFSTQTREGWEGALKILSTDINDFRSPAQMSCNPPWGGKKQAFNPVCRVCESTHVNTCVACRREGTKWYANKDRYLPRLAGEKESAKLHVRCSVIDFSFRNCSAVILSLFHVRV